MLVNCATRETVRGLKGQELIIKKKQVGFPTDIYEFRDILSKPVAFRKAMSQQIVDIWV